MLLYLLAVCGAVIVEEVLQLLGEVLIHDLLQKLVDSILVVLDVVELWVGLDALVHDGFVADSGCSDPLREPVGFSSKEEAPTSFNLFFAT